MKRNGMDCMVDLLHAPNDRMVGGPVTKSKRNPYNITTGYDGLLDLNWQGENLLLLNSPPLEIPSPLPSAAFPPLLVSHGHPALISLWR